MTPKPEKIPQPHAKAKRRPGSQRRKPPGPKGGDDAPPRGSVPKVPLVKV